MSRVIKCLGSVFIARYSETMLTGHLLTGSIGVQEQPCVDPSVLLLEENALPSVSKPAPQMPFDEQPNGLCCSVASFASYRDLDLEETPDRVNFGDAGWVLDHEDFGAEQGSDTASSLDFEPHRSTECTLADLAEHACLRKIPNVVISSEAVTYSLSESPSSPGGQRQAEPIDNEGNGYDAMCSVSFEGAYTDATAITERGATQGLITTCRGRKEYSGNKRTRIQEANRRSTDSSLHNGVSLHVIDVTGTSQDGNEEIRSPIQARASPTAASERASYHSRKRKRSTTRRSIKRGGCLQDHIVLQGSNEVLLDQYILHERRKYKNLGMTCPEQSFDSSVVQERISTLGTDRHTTVLKTFFFAVASCESVAVLQDILRACRNTVADELPEPSKNLSNAKRLEVIELLGGRVACFSLLQKCHILRLFADNCDFFGQMDDGFRIDTQKSISTRTGRKSGNPSHLVEAEITKSMIREIYPGLQSNSAGYTKKYRSVSDLRKLGRRLHLLTTTFGYGILGLLPSATHCSIEGRALCITDSMCVRLDFSSNNETNLVSGF